MNTLKIYKNKLIPKELQFNSSLSSYYNMNKLVAGLKRSYKYTIECVDKLNHIEKKNPLMLSSANTYIVYTTTYLSEFEKFYIELTYRLSINKKYRKLKNKLEYYVNKLRVILPNCNLLFTYY